MSVCYGKGNEDFHHLRGAGDCFCLYSALQSVSLYRVTQEYPSREAGQVAGTELYSYKLRYDQHCFET